VGGGGKGHNKKMTKSFNKFMSKIFKFKAIYFKIFLPLNAGMPPADKMGRYDIFIFRNMDSN